MIIIYTISIELQNNLPNGDMKGNNNLGEM